MGLISEQLQNITDATERAAIKTAAYNQVITNLPLKIKNIVLDDGRVVIIEKFRVGRLVNNSEIISDPEQPILWLRLKVNNKYLNGDGWYGFVNPPIMVPDGTVKQVLNPLTNTVIEVPNYKEDILAALKQILTDVLKENK